MNLSIFILSLLLLGQAFSTQNEVQIEEESKNILIEFAKREVDLTQRYASAITNMRISNVNGDRINTFYYAAPVSQFSQTISVVLKVANSEKIIFGDVVNSADARARNATLIKFDLPETLSTKGSSLQITIEEQFSKRQVPFPKEITINEDQLILYTDNAYIFSVYPIQTQQTIYKANKIVSYTDGQKGSKYRQTGVKYGSYENIPEFSYLEVQIHCENNTPLIYLTKAIKTVHVSHWGNIAVDGHYNLVNAGALLKGEFSRVDVNKYNPNSGKNALKQLSAELPYHSTGVWYRDVIGNISTSNAQRDRNDKVVKLNIAPRFPVIGGWKSNWSLGYNLNMTQYVSTDSKGQFMLKQAVSFPFLDLHAEEYELRVVLPEGATRISFDFPYSIDSWKEEITYNYLDIEGSPTFVFYKKNVIDIHNQYFYIYYDLSTTSVLKKPLSLFLASFALFLTVIILNRLDLKSLRTKKQN